MPNDFVRNPGGSNSTPKAPPSFVQAPPDKSGQAKYDGGNTNPKSVPSGGPSVLPAITKTDDPGNPIGAGSLGNSRKPFKLNG
jgi:hypothetical protein